MFTRDGGWSFHKLHDAILARLKGREENVYLALLRNSTRRQHLETLCGREIALGLGEQIVNFRNLSRELDMPVGTLHRTFKAMEKKGLFRVLESAHGPQGGVLVKLAEPDDMIDLRMLHVSRVEQLRSQLTTQYPKGIPPDKFSLWNKLEQLLEHLRNGLSSLNQRTFEYLQDGPGTESGTVEVLNPRLNALEWIVEQFGTLKDDSGLHNMSLSTLSVDNSDSKQNTDVQPEQELPIRESSKDTKFIASIRTQSHQDRFRSQFPLLQKLSDYWRAVAREEGEDRKLEEVRLASRLRAKYSCFEYVPAIEWVRKNGKVDGGGAPPSITSYLIEHCDAVLSKIDAEFKAESLKSLSERRKKREEKAAKVGAEIVNRKAEIFESEFPDEFSRRKKITELRVNFPEKFPPHVKLGGNLEFVIAVGLWEPPGRGAIASDGTGEG